MFDNGFSVSILVELLPEIDLGNVLLVFSGAEEVSGGTPYHGRGYRAFEEEYTEAVENCEHLVVVDCVGMGETEKKNSAELYNETLALEGDHQEKFVLLEGDWDQIKTVYHSPADTVGALTDPGKTVEEVRKHLGKLTGGMH